MTHGITRSALLSGLLAAALAAPAAFPVDAAVVGGVATGTGSTANRGIWEGRIRITHHIGEVTAYVSVQTVTGRTGAECNVALSTAFNTASLEPGAQVVIDTPCYWHP